MNTKVKHVIVAFFSLTLLFSTLFVQVMARNAEEEKNVKFGYPISFIVQDFSVFKDEFKFFPIYENFQFKMEAIKSFSVMNFIGSYIIIFLSLEILICILETVDFKIRNYFTRDEE